MTEPTGGEETPLLAYFKRLKHTFEYDPIFQTKFHLFMSYLWIANMFIAVAVFVFLQGLWLKASILYLVIVSLYANFATDYGAVSASEASEHTNDLQE